MNPKIQSAIKILSYAILFISSMCVYSYYVYTAATEGKESFALAQPILNFATYPKTINEVLTSKEVKGLAPTYSPIDSSFIEVNEMTYDLFALNSFWDNDSKNWEVRLFNLKNDEIIHKWRLFEKNVDLSTTDWQFSNAMPRNCALLENDNIIVSADETANLFRLDGQSNIVWKNQEVIFHHSLNLDADSNIWVCTTDLIIDGKTPVRGVKNINGNIYQYNDEYLTQIDKKNGVIIFHKSLADILIENGYPNYVYGLSDPDKNAQDPLHLNDIEPVLENGAYWKKGDVFVSVRHRSLVFLYRPETNKILRIINGPFLAQHDVDILPNNEIAIFNNNFIHFDGDSLNDFTITKIDDLKSSQIVTYNFEDSTFNTPYLNHFINEGIKTETQGMQTYLSNGDIFVESQNQGRLFIFNKENIVLKKTLENPKKGYIYQPNWIRVYEELN